MTEPSHKAEKYLIRGQNSDGSAIAEQHLEGSQISEQNNLSVVSARTLSSAT